MPDITQLARIHASPDRVYRALTTADGIRNWWTRDAIFESKVGGTAEFGFFNHRIVTRMRIDELTPPVRVGWRALWPAAPGWEGTTVTFDLREEDGATLLSLTHRGFEQEDESYGRTAKGWAHYLLSLHRYLEAGEGTPHEQ
jgi:uncharacterized protein YndB with AHSA1/START domain